MNYLYLGLFVAFYAASLIPMIAADKVNNAFLVGTVFLVDCFLTAVAYVLLWYAMPATIFSLLAVLTWSLFAYEAGVIMRNGGFDPYGVTDILEKRKLDKDQQSAII